ncbi:hypothetical protein ACHWQZ_G018735 [Mnemiopsis leidyi]
MWYHVLLPAGSICALYYGATRFIILKDYHRFGKCFPDHDKSEFGWVTRGRDYRITGRPLGQKLYDYEH